MRLISKKWLALLAVGAVAIITAVGVYAYWTQGGTGTGTAGTGSTTGITVNQTSAPGNTLYPGGPSQALSGNFDNPNSGSVTISSVTAVVSSVTGGAGDLSLPACTPADFSIGGSAAGSTVPSGTGVGSWSGLTISLQNGAGNQDNCKNATAHITYTANA